MTKLTDTQSLLLSAASQRADGSILPLPATVRPGGGTAKAMVALIRRGLAEERNAPDGDGGSGSDAPYGVFLTAAGAAAIGVDLPEQGDGQGGADAPPRTPAPPAGRITKSAAVVALLERAGGATLPELIEATGWLPHTVRAALTGLRKRGHEVVRTKREGATCYRIGGAA